MTTLNICNPELPVPHPLPECPPSAIEAEQRVLGAILTGALQPALTFLMLDAEHFVDPVHGAIVTAMGKGPEDGPGLGGLLAHFDATGGLDDVGGPAYLLQLESIVPDGYDADPDVQAIRRTWAERVLMDAATTEALAASGGGA